VRQTVRYRSVGSNLPKMLEVSACRRESRAVRYSNTPSGVTARTLTQDDTCHPDRSQSNVVAFAGRRILRMFVGLPKRPGSMLPVVRHDISGSAARLRYRGVDRRLDSVWRPGGVDRSGRSPTDHTFGSGPILRERCWAHCQIHEWFAAVPLSRSIRSVARRCDNDRLLSRLVLEQSVADRLPSSSRLFGGVIEPWMDPQPSCKRVHDPGLRRQFARTGCIESGSTSNQRVRRKMASHGETVSQSLCRKTVRVG